MSIEKDITVILVNIMATLDTHFYCVEQHGGLQFQQNYPVYGCFYALNSWLMTFGLHKSITITEHKTSTVE